MWTSTPPLYTKRLLADTLRKFWGSHPALLLAASVAVGIAHVPAAIAATFVMTIPLLLSRATRRLAIAALATLLVAATYTAAIYRLPTLPAAGEKGAIHFHINNVKTTVSHSRAFDIYTGQALTYTPDGRSSPTGTHLPCSVRIPHRSDRYAANTDYLISGTVTEYAPGRYSIRPDKNRWTLVRDSWSLAESRYRWKQAVTHHLRSHLDNGPVCSFLVGLATGEFGDRLLAMEFARFGLQHIMAISGFHFAIVALMLQLLLRPFLPRRLGAATLIVLLSSYYLFLGNSASIQRAWIASVVILSAPLFERDHRPLNTLGIAMLVVLFLDPLQLWSLGFQLSFGITTAILLFYRPIDDALRHLIRHRRLSSVVSMAAADQHGYLLLAALRSAIALTLAVHIAAIPAVLYFFHKFPLMGLLYNLFFPLLTSVTMLLLLLGLLATPIPPLASAIHAANGAFTAFLLDTVFDAPITLDVALRCRHLPGWLLASWLVTALFAGIMLHEKRRGFTMT